VRYATFCPERYQWTAAVRGHNVGTVRELAPNLYLVRPEFGQLYLWRDGDELTLVDTGTPGSGENVVDAIRRLGLDREALRWIVVTHFHGDHAGSLAEIREWSDAPVYAHAADADLIRGVGEVPLPILTDWERPIWERVGNHISPPPAEVDHELTGGETLDFGGGAEVLPVPGHTPGSIALHLPAHRLLFTGDTIAESGGSVILGVFNVDREQAVRSLRAQAELDVDVVCFGHGEPVLSDGSARLRQCAGQLSQG
jgi:glyoxylase-like metal-dependent hydrolase (beta-lactamase superfamily II)